MQLNKSLCGSVVLVAAIATVYVGVLMTASAAVAQNSSQIPNPCDPIEGNCGDPTDPGDPLAALNAAGDSLAAMRDDLMANWFNGGLCATLDALPPDVTDNGETQDALSAVTLVKDGVLVGSGTLSVTTHLSDGRIDLVLYIEQHDGFGAVSRASTLTQTIWAYQGGVEAFGTVEVAVPFAGNWTYSGGWTYTAGDGPDADAASDAGFHDEVGIMLGCDAQNIAAGFGLGNMLGMIGNITNIAINYIRDWFRPYTPPTSCSGPSILDGTGQSCEGKTIPCRDALGDVAQYLDDLPSVSTAFKQCMKGRLGCGGSSFPRLRVSCDDSDSCGACASLASCETNGCLGCNLGGSTLWYCEDEDATSCDCVETILHEASHSCGARDLQNESTYDSYRIGDWFDAEFKERESRDAYCISTSGLSATPGAEANE